MKGKESTKCQLRSKARLGMTHYDESAKEGAEV